MAPQATAPARRPAGSSRDEADKTLDGRVVRGARTRHALAEALVSLLEQGEARPTARQVAERAGVSLRLVYHHFEDMEAVLRSAVAIQVERHWSRRQHVDRSLPLEERVTALVRQRATLFEAIAPVRRAAASVEPESPTVAAELDRARHELRAEVADIFAPELTAAGGRRTELLDMVELVTAWESWDQLRRRMGRSVSAARRVTISLTIAALHTGSRHGGSR